MRRIFSLLFLARIILLQTASGMNANVALSKKTYTNEKHQAKNGVDGDPDTYAICKGGWFVVDMGGQFSVHKAEIRTRRECCGEKMDYFKVGLLNHFNENETNPGKNEKCGAFDGNTETDKAYKIICADPYTKFRYAMLYVDDPDSQLIFSLFKLFGYEKGDYKNLALKKKAYAIDPYPQWSSLNGVDGDLKSITLSFADDWWFVVDLGRDYRVHYVELYTRPDCCGDRTSNFSVGLLTEFNERSFQRNELCGQFQGATETLKRYRLNCTQPFNQSRYVSLFVEKRLYDDIGFAEFKVFAEEKTDFSIQYAGCYEGKVKRQNSTVTSIDQCIYICRIRDFKYAGVANGTECGCQNIVARPVSSSNCNMKCPDDDHICGGKDHLSVYNVSECVEGNKPVACTQHCTQALTNGVCLGGCEAGWRGKHCHLRDCASDNGMCGEDICAAFSTGPVNLTECVCRKGFGKKRDHYDNCTDINECEQDVCSDKKLECQNSVGSYQCVLIKENEKVDIKAVVGGVIGFLLIMALIILVVYCVKRRRKAKYSSNLQRDTNNPANA